MQRLCSVRILCSIACFLMLCIFITSEVKCMVEAAVCGNQVLPCADLGNLTAPFWGNSSCPDDENFFVSNCSDKQALWPAFVETMEGSNLGPPRLTGMRKMGFATYINLTWSSDVNACMLPELNKVDLYVPEVINLTGFANGSFQVSDYNRFLLFECNMQAPDFNSTAEADSSLCTVYQKQCQASNFSCAELITPFDVLALKKTLLSLSCSRFTILATSDLEVNIKLWQFATIQLKYNDTQCQACMKTGGLCSYDNATRNFQQCNCGKSGSSDTDCLHIQTGCSSVLCHKGWTIAIFAPVTVVGTAMIMFVLFWVYQKRRGYSTKSFSIPSSNHLLTQRAYMLSKKFGPVATREYSFQELSKATKSFADENMIGDGGFGAVYLGVLKNGCEVAVKRLYHDNFRRMDHFYNEIKILSNLDHPNLVKLHGFCCQDSNDLLLVFEYAENGTVSDQLHDTTKPAMPWKTRLTIAMETAEALSYLHNLVTPPIYHRDVKTTNILLDGELHAKLADFGLSRLVPLEATHVSTAPQGTPGYLDPDYHQCYQLTDKSDVYSFGVVLVELVSAKLAVDMSRDRREINLSSLALMKIGCGMWEDLVDPRLEIKKNPQVEMMVKRVIELAFMCLNAEKDSRPTMEQVAEALRKMCQECGYYDNGHAFSFRTDVSPSSSMDETRHLIRAKSVTKSRRAADSTTDWSSTNTSASSTIGS